MSIRKEHRNDPALSALQQAPRVDAFDARRIVDRACGRAGIPVDTGAGDDG